MDQNAEVHFAYNYGDHWRTQVAPKISEVFEGTVRYSEYHRMDKLVEVDYDEETGGYKEGVRTVVMLG
jgi:hypothetical protein